MSFRVLDAVERVWTAKVIASYNEEDGQEKTEKDLDVI
jgi:hypothetical protein